jgi:hypothetical protein
MAFGPMQGFCYDSKDWILYEIEKIPGNEIGEERANYIVSLGQGVWETNVTPENADSVYFGASDRNCSNLDESKLEDSANPLSQKNVMG